MFKISRYLCGFLLLILPLQAIEIGEHFRYKAYLGPFYVGEFSFEVKSTENIRNEEVYFVHFKSNIKQVDKKSNIYLRTKDFRPIMVERYYFDRDYETEIYDPETNMGYVYNKDDFSTPNRTFQGIHQLHTPLSLLFYLREQPLAINDSFDVETTDEILHVNVEKKQLINDIETKKVTFKPMGLTVFYATSEPHIIPEVRWNFFLHDIKIKLK